MFRARRCDVSTLTDARGQLGDSFDGVRTLSLAGRRTPASPKALVSNAPASGRRPPELDDREWLKARYERDGDPAIALELTAKYERSISRKTVMVARERLGIPSLPPGRRRTEATVRVLPRRPAREPAAMRIVARMAREQREDDLEVSYDLLLGRFVNVDRARKAGDRLGLLEELEALGAAAGLLLDHELALEAA